MRKISVLLCIVVFASGCVTAPYMQHRQHRQQAKSIWPPPVRHKYYWPSWQMLSNAEEAIGVLKNLQHSFVEFTAGQPFKTFDVDKYGLRGKWEWSETTNESVYVPTYGGYWIGGQYVPYYGGTNQIRTNTSQHAGELVIPFAEVSALWIWYDPGLVQEYKWGLSVSLDNKALVGLRAPDEKTIRQLGNAIVTLCKEQGRIMSRYLFGIAVNPLTPEQSAELTLSQGTGLLVLDVYVGSPGEKAGVRFLDVILEVDGQPVKDESELNTLSLDKKSVNFKILRREKVADAAGKISLQNTEVSLSSNVDGYEQNTVIISRQAATALSGLGNRKAEVFQEASKYCEKKGKKLQVISTWETSPPYLNTNLPKAEIRFLCLDANDPQLQRTRLEKSSDMVIKREDTVKADIDVHTKDETAKSPDLYTELMKLGELRKQGILTEAEFQAQKKLLLEKQNE